MNGLSAELVFESSSVEDIGRGIVEAMAGERKLPSASECKLYARSNFASTMMAQRIAEIYREIV